MNLTKLDYEILNFITKFEKVEEEKVLYMFSKDKGATQYRLELLSKAGHIEYEIKELEIQCITHQIPTDICFITNLGRKTLEDYISEQSFEEKRYKETTAIAKRSNNIAFAALVISIFAIIATFVKSNQP